MKSAVSRVLSGIQPTGIPHLGNYLGSLQTWINLQKDYASGDFTQNPTPTNKQLTDEPQLTNVLKTSNVDKKLFYFLADLHSLTTLKKNLNLKQSSFESAAIILACGIDPKKSVLFKQSAVPAHSELMWVLSCITPIGQLNRMTTWKSKIKESQEGNPLESVLGELGDGFNDNSASSYSGLFMYPVLQAADILLYRPSHVPVGEDQSQHLELTRNLAESFNKKTNSKSFILPETLLTPTKRVMSLKDPSKKMSKSDPNPKSTIVLTDSQDQVKSKIMKAVTDSISEIFYDPVNRPGVSNLLEIYAALDPQINSPQDACKTVFKGIGSRKLKLAVADIIAEKISPIQNEYEKLIQDPQYINDVLSKGAEQANQVASATMMQVKKTLNLL